MKKFIALACTAIFSLFATAQTWPNYKGRVKILGSIIKNDTGNYVTSKMNTGINAQGAYGHIGYGVNYDYREKTIELNVGYASLREINTKSMVFSLGPAVIIKPNTDRQKSKSVFLGGSFFVVIEKEKSFEIELTTRYAGKLKNHSNDWNQSSFLFKFEGIKKIIPIFGIGINFDYNSNTISEPTPKDDQTLYNGEVSTRAETSAGMFFNFEYKSFCLNFGPELRREKNSYMNLNQPKTWEAGNWLLNWRASVVYKFQY